MIGQPKFHRRCDLECLMHSTSVGERKVERNRGMMAFKRLAVGMQYGHLVPAGGRCYALP